MFYLAGLNGARQALWGYLIWYVLVLVRYFDPSPRLWLTSLGLSAIIGVALILSTAGTNATTRLDRWQIFRLFLMPFCVSSFAALVKDQVTKLRDTGSPEVAFRVAVKDGKVNFTVRGMKGTGEQ